MSMESLAFLFALFTGAPVQGLLVAQGVSGLHLRPTGIPLRFSDGFPKQNKAEEFRARLYAQSSKSKKRVIIWGGIGKAGLQDRLWHISNFLALAAKLGATFYLPAPEDILGGHPVEAPPWWDTYIFTVPQLHHLGELPCDADVPVMSLRPSMRFDGLIRDFDAFIDTDQPLCLEISANLDEIDWGKAQSLIGIGGDLITFHTSEKVEKAVSRAEDFIKSSLHGDESQFNAVHVRQGDKGYFDCMEPRNVVNKMISITARASNESPLSVSSTWFVMSMAGRTWFNDISGNASEAGLTTITEKEVPVIAEQHDGMMQYLIGLCLWHTANLELYTWSSLPDILCGDGRTHMTDALDCPAPSRL